MKVAFIWDIVSSVKSVSVVVSVVSVVVSVSVVYKCRVCMRALLHNMTFVHY